MSKLEFDRFEEWFRASCTCLEDDEIDERLKVDLQETVDTEEFVFTNLETQHDWEVWQAATKAESDKTQPSVERGWVFRHEESDTEIGFADAETYENATQAVEDFGRHYAGDPYLVYFRDSNGNLCSCTYVSTPEDFD